MAASALAKKEVWARKTWFRVSAPQWLGGKTVGETPAAKPQDLVGRTLTVSLNELTGNMRHFQTEVVLRIREIEGDTAQTDYAGQEVARDVVARLVRRWASRVDLVRDVKTAEGKSMRLKVLVITQKRVNTATQTAIRNEVAKILGELFEGKPIEQIVTNINAGKAMKEVMDRARKIYPLRAAEIRKIEVS